MASKINIQQKLPFPIRSVAPVAGFLFLIVFSIHFCAFHAGHSVFLQMFFPLEGLPRDGFGEAFMNPPLLWWMAFKHLLIPYGIFLIPAIIAERKHIFHPLLKAANAAPMDLHTLAADLKKMGKLIF